MSSIIPILAMIIVAMDDPLTDAPTDLAAATIATAIRRFFADSGIAPCRIVVAASGGVDSTALLVALGEMRNDGFELVCAHVNHHLRGAESDADQTFVEELCHSMAVPLALADGALDPQEIRTRGIEGAARTVRYARLTAIRDEVGARFVATAHQKNDQAETVMMRLITGSGIAGLRGIHPVRDDGFVRPLLDVRREEIEAFLHERGLTPRVDRSNDDPRFLRNRVRRAVRELGAVDGLASIAEQSRMLWPIVERAIDQAERAGAEIGENETRFHSWPESSWLRQALLHRHIRRLDPAARDVGSRALGRLASQLDHIRRTSVTKRLELVRQGDVLILRTRPQPVPPFEVELTPAAPASVPTLGIAVHVRTADESDPQTREPLTLTLSPRRGERGPERRKSGTGAFSKPAAEEGITIHHHDGGSSEGERQPPINDPANVEQAPIVPDSPLSPPRGERVRVRGSLPPGNPSTGHVAPWTTADADRVIPSRRSRGAAQDGRGIPFIAGDPSQPTQPPSRDDTRSEARLTPSASLPQLIQLPPGADPRFTVRNRRRGDRFQPLGLGAAKKLKDVLIDRKIPRETRDRIPLVVWQGEIVWIAGVELSERFKVTDSGGDRYAVWMEDSDGATDPDRSDPGLHR